MNSVRLTAGGWMAEVEVISLNGGLHQALEANIYKDGSFNLSLAGRNCRWLKTTPPTLSDLASLAARTLDLAIGEHATSQSRLSTNLDQLVRLAAGASPTPGATDGTSVGNAALSAASTLPASPTGPSGETVRNAKK